MCPSSRQFGHRQPLNKKRLCHKILQPPGPPPAKCNVREEFQAGCTPRAGVFPGRSGRLRAMEADRRAAAQRKAEKTFPRTSKRTLPVSVGGPGSIPQARVLSLPVYPTPYPQSPQETGDGEGAFTGWTVGVKRYSPAFASGVFSPGEAISEPRCHIKPSPRAVTSI